MAATNRTQHEAEEFLSFDAQWENLQKNLEKKYSCSLKLRRVNKPGERPYLFLYGSFVGSRMCLSRLINRNIFPWESILPDCHELFEKQFGKEKYYLVPMNVTSQTELR